MLLLPSLCRFGIWYSSSDLYFQDPIFLFFLLQLETKSITKNVVSECSVAHVDTGLLMGFRNLSLTALCLPADLAQLR